MKKEMVVISQIFTIEHVHSIKKNQNGFMKGQSTCHEIVVSPQGNKD